MPDAPTDMLPPMLLASVEPLDATALAAEMAAADERTAAVAILGDSAPAPSRPLWTPADVGEAEWAMAHVRANHRQIAAAQEQARLWHQQIDAWLADEITGAEHRAGFFDGALVRYADARLAADPKLRTIKLPSGDVKVTVPQQGTVHVADEDAVICWADASGYEAAVKRPPPPAPTVLVSEVRKVAQAVEGPSGWVAVDKATGEVVPGAEARPPAEPTVKVQPHISLA